MVGNSFGDKRDLEKQVDATCNRREQHRVADLKRVAARLRLETGSMGEMPNQRALDANPPGNASPSWIDGSILFLLRFCLQSIIGLQIDCLRKALR